jgi:3-phosphoglycerate kinase
MLKKIQDADVEKKKVLLRVDFNVGVDEGVVKEKFKIEAAKESLDYLLALGAKVALFSYMGRPGGKKDSQFSFGPIRDDVEYILGAKVKFVSDCVGEDVKRAMDELLEGEVLLLENARFYLGEDENDDSLAKQMADGFEVFINDAFSQSHRNQASITGITKYLPSFAGFRLQKEVEEMERIKNNLEHPAVAIIGGAKIETKLPVIKFFEEKCDYVLVGGKIANEALDQNVEFSSKVNLPTDFGAERFDIGSETIARYKEIISYAKTVIWNGPLGKFEDEKFAVGTNEILKAILESQAYVIIGGGETLEVLEKNNIKKDIEKRGFVSTGGGAMLTYLSGEKMPGIEVLSN